MPEKRSGQHGQHRATRRERRALRAVRSPSTEIAGLRGPFVAWLTEHGLPDDVDLQALWADVLAAVDLAVARAGLTDLHAWTAAQVTATQEAAVEEAAGEEDGGLLAALPLLIGFLGATGRWHGTEEEWVAAVAAADSGSDPVTAVLERLAAVETDDDEEDAALRAIPVVAQAEELVRFLLPRRAVTATGALRRADIPTAAGIVGVDVGARTPQSMWDVARLPAIWTALADAGLVAIGRAEAVPSPAAYAWVNGDRAAARVARRAVLGGYLTTVLAEPSRAAFLPDPLETLLPALAAAALGRPMTTERLFGVADLDDLAGDGGAVLLGFATMIARDRVESLAGDGILVMADTVDVVPGLRRVVARTVAALLGAPAPGSAGPPGSAPDVPPVRSGEGWRIRVDLEDTRPPVWREAVVDPAIPLDELHEVIQRLFGWEDAHLHEFLVLGPGRRAVRYAPPLPDGGWGSLAGRPRPEARTRLDQVLGHHRGGLVYRYDFGDSWEHRITVVGTEPAGGPLPRCVAGSGAAPAEDSGGPWGWAEMVAAANDPRHPEHEDTREWLGLAPGQRIDPAAFDPAATDKRLGGLRH